MPVLAAPSRICRGWGAVFLLGAAALCLHTAPVRAETRNVPAQPSLTVVLSERGGSYEEFGAALDRLLSGRGVGGYRVITAADPLPASGLVIAVGMKAAAAVAASEAPLVLNVLITKASQGALLRDFPRRANSRSYSAIYLDQPASREARLIAAILPAGKGSVGLLYATPPRELAQLQEKLGELGLTLHAQEVDAALPLPEALRQVLERSDALLAVPDPAVYNDSTIRNVLLSSYRAEVPLIGLSPGYVKAGALCAVFTTPAQVAAQAAAVAVQAAETQALPAAQYPQEFEVMVNEQVARSLNLRVRAAAALHDEIEESPQ